MRLFILVFVSGVLGLSSAAEAGCWAGDTEISRWSRTETRSCTTSGYCYAYDYNPATGQYEYFYGFHTSCDGTERRSVDELTCQRTDLSTYTATDEGFWGMCQMN